MSLWSCALHPPVHECIEPAACTPTVPLPLRRVCLQAHDDWAAKKTRAKQLPYSMLEELKSAARCAEPGVVYPLQ